MAVDLVSLGSSFASGLGQSLGGGGGPSSNAARQDNPFDSSGWNVSLGSGSIDSARAQTAAGALSDYVPYLLAGLAVVVAWKLLKKKR